MKGTKESAVQRSGATLGENDQGRSLEEADISA